jgi:hypothetical protein
MIELIRDLKINAIGDYTFIICKAQADDGDQYYGNAFHLIKL